MTMKGILATALGIAIIAVIVLSGSLSRVMEDNDRLESNQEALLTEVKYYKTENGKNAATVQRLSLDYGELRRHYNDKCSIVDELGIKLKRVQSMSSTGTESRVRIKTVVRDSIIYRDRVSFPVRAFSWADPWVDISGVIEADTADISVHSRDTLTQVIHRVPHRFWFIKWGTKAIRQEIVSSNPHTEITYSDYIELKK